MKAIDYLTIFFLLGSAPSWQSTLDGAAAGLGTALLLLMMISIFRLLWTESAIPPRKNRRASHQHGGS